MKILASLYLTVLTLIFIGCNNEVPTPTPPGPEWRTYNRANSPIGSNRVLCMTLDSDGSLWFGTDSGASHFNPRTGGWTSFRDSLRTSGGAVSSVRSITQGKDRSIWFGTLGAGAVRFNPFSQTGRTWSRYTADNSILPTVVSGIAADKSAARPYGEVWAATSVGVYVFHQTSADEGTWQYYQPSAILSGLPSDQMVSAVTNPIDNHIWFGAQIGGAIEVYFDTDYRWGRYESPAEQYRVNSIAFDLTSNVWFGKEIGASRLHLTSGGWTYYTADSTNGQFPGGAVNSLETDYHTTRWFGTDSGVVLLEDTSYSRFTQDNSPLPNNRISSVELDLRGNLWIGTQFGVAVYRKGGTVF